LCLKGIETLARSRAGEATPEYGPKQVQPLVCRTKLPRSGWPPVPLWRSVRKTSQAHSLRPEDLMVYNRCPGLVVLFSLLAAGAASAPAPASFARGTAANGA
jgi:hypothetical protein